MKLSYFNNEISTPLVEEFYELSFSKDTVPFESTLLPIALNNITFIYSGNQKAIVDNKEMPLDGLIVSGQFFRSYKFIVGTEGHSIGMSFHPTALHKLLNTNVSKLSNKHLPLVDIDLSFYEQLEPIFNPYEGARNTVKKITDLINSMPLTINKNTILIDKLIDVIRKKEGMVHVDELVERSSVSQKTMETQFKKIVGQTPGKYIRLYRFLKLMRQYESQEIVLKDLIYMYNYYDRSHFVKDFKLFMHETPKQYFKKDYPLLKSYLKA